jgi:hypothetical protein
MASQGTEEDAYYSYKGDGVLREGTSVKYARINQHRNEFPITGMCRVLGVSRSGFKVVGWAVSQSLATELVQAEFKDVVEKR